jgi:heavy metal sensor kinase
LSLRLRLALTSTTLTAGALLLIGVLLHLLFARSLYDQLDARIRSQTRNLAAYLQRVATEVKVPPGRPAGERGREVAKRLAHELGEGITLAQNSYVQLSDPAGRLTYVSSNLGTARLSTDGAERPGPLSVASVAQPGLGRLRQASTRVLLPWGEYRLVTAASLAPANQAIAALDRVFLFALPLTFSLVALVGFVMADRALRPVARITAAARAIRAGDLERRIALAGPADELKELADTFDEMIAALEALLRAQQQFLADASHELRTPLTVLLSALEITRRGPEPDAASLRETLATLHDEARRMKRLVDDLMLLARTDTGEQVLRLEPVDLGPLLTAVRESARWMAPDRRLTLRLDDDPRVLGDPDRLRQLLLNLLDNAVRHTAPGGSVTLALGTADECALISVTDDGEGIPAEHLPRVFDRFYRADRARGREAGGAGLGLAICRWIAEAHRGRLTVESQAPGGTTFTLRLPLQPPYGPR